MPTSFFSDMLQTISDRGRRLLSLGPVRDMDGAPARAMERLCETLLTSRGEASGLALAREILNGWRRLDDAGKRDFMALLVESFGADTARLEKAIAEYQKTPSPSALMELHSAAEPRRQELIRRMNMAPGGIAALVGMREMLLKMKPDNPGLEALDADFAHLFASWFNRGFLMLKSINWATPANILEKIIRYEAVHDIGGWEELRLRLAPEDRRCFAFFHPQLADDPLIFVEVALTQEIPERIGDVLREDRTTISAKEATTAVFYSISNCQNGLRGISFGNFLIKQVVEDLKRELPKLETFVTLSPVPGFAAWLDGERKNEGSTILTAEDRDKLKMLDQPGWEADETIKTVLQPVMTRAAASYFLKARNSRGKIIDPVARFHLGNGARLERINYLGDMSPRALRQSYGLMVNYLYQLDAIEENHEAFAGRNEVVAATPLRRLVPAEKAARKQNAGPTKETKDATAQNNSKELSA